jgi:hypothetical protein
LQPWLIQDVPNEADLMGKGLDRPCIKPSLRVFSDQEQA